MASEEVSQEVIRALVKLERQSHFIALVLFAALGAGASWLLWLQLSVSIKVIVVLGFLALVGLSGMFMGVAGLARTARFGRLAQTPGLRLEQAEGGVLFELPDGPTKVWFVSERAVEVARLQAGLPRAQIRDSRPRSN